MGVNKEEIEILFKKMMEDLEGFTQTDEIYQEDMKDFKGLLELQWKMCGLVGYQIFGKDSYSYKFGEELDDPGVTLEINDTDLAAKFLKVEPFEFGYEGAENGFNITHTEEWTTDDPEEDSSKRTRKSRIFLTAQIDPKKGFHPFMLSKLPMFRDWTKQNTDGENEFGAYLPINQTLGNYENQIIPMKIFKHFIDKASGIVARDCPCRVNNDCKDHSKTLGCMMMGDATIGMAMPQDEKGRFVSKEEALEVVRLSIEDGLVPVLGRSSMEAGGYDVTDTAHF